MAESSGRTELQDRIRATETVALSHSFEPFKNPQHQGSSSVPLVLVHGLFGSSRNWQSIAQVQSEKRSVYAVDQRNHGNSPHHSSHTLYDMVADLHRWHQDNLKQPAVYLGHSMGGLSVMGLALLFPELVAKLVVVDIAPRSYEPHHGPEFRALEMDVSGFSSRQEIDDAMAEIHPAAAVRRFLQMNLVRDKQGYRWGINVSALKNAAYLQGFQEGFPDLQYEGPTLAMKGEKSNYIQDSDRELFRRFFPSCKLIELKGADHWLHYSAQDSFLETLQVFLDS